MLDRRDAMIGLGRAGLGALALPELLRAQAHAALPRPNLRTGRAKSCILIFLWGGPPQQDMWDLKPDAPEAVRSLFQPIKTTTGGLDVCDQMPQFARVANKVTIIRSVTHESNEHEASVYHVLTGQVDPSQRIPRNNRTRQHWPHPGAIVSCLQPSAPHVPSSVTLPRPVMHDGIKYSGTHAGWLGAKHDPLELPDQSFANGRPTWDFGLPDGVAPARVSQRRRLLDLIEAQQRHLETEPTAVGMDAFRQRAFDLIASPAAKQAFNLEQESPALRDRYGRNHYGESFLLCRRLVEAGVRLVTFNWMYFRPDGNPLNPWDNHGGTPALGGITGYEMLKQEYGLPSLDRGLSTLLEDLDQRGLLDETLVVVMGEFGRTPKINKTGGRDHWGACQSVMLAGGGIRRGFVYGASDAEAAYPTENPVRPEDLLATMYTALGLPPSTEIRMPDGRPQPISTGSPIRAVFG